MPRLSEDPNRLDPAAYPQVFSMRAAYANVDSFQHINNVAIAAFFEEGRATMNMAVFGTDAVVRPSAGVQLLFASVAIDYVTIGAYPGDVTIATAVSKIGRSSFSQAGGLFQEGRCVALCDAVTVYSVDGAPTALPASALKVLENLRLRA
jgi:acyl-CoA thioester hydrolase